MDLFPSPEENTNDILDDMCRKRNNDANYIMPRDRPIHVIVLLGRTRVGKTTISNVIRDSLYCPSWSSVRISTKSTVVHRVGGLNIIDTADIFDQHLQPSKCNIINRRLVIDHFTIPFIDGNLPLFGLVFSIQRGISSDDITAMINFKNKFPRLSQKMFLILTHCEEKTEDQRLQLIDEFFDHSRLREVNMRNFFERGVLFMGCIRRQSLENGNKKALTFEHRQVLEMRAEFIRQCQKNRNIIGKLYKKSSIGRRLLRIIIESYDVLCFIFVLYCLIIGAIVYTLIPAVCLP